MTNSYEEFLEDLFASEVEIKRKPKDMVLFNEVVELFVSSTIEDIMEEYEDTPRVNIIFSDEGLVWLRDLLKAPFKKEGYCIPNMTENDIKKLSRENQSDPESPTIVVKDYRLFFELLTNVVNEQVSLYYDYGRNISARAVGLMLMQRIWQRMSAEDFDNVELFLKKQLEFLKNREFDEPLKEKFFKDYNGYKITYEVEMCELWCESTRRMCFKIYDGKEYHSLPNVYYDICCENGEMVCYISAVQMPRYRNRIKSVERELYKLNKNIVDSKVHPNKLMAMKLFYEMLRLHGITRIKVPVMQILSYRYHEILSNHVREEFNEKWNSKQLDYMNSLKDSDLMVEKLKYERLLKRYERDKINYDSFVDKEDFISENKIEGLINLFMNMTYIDEMMVINTELYINASYLDIDLDGDKKVNKR